MKKIFVLFVCLFLISIVNADQLKQLGPEDITYLGAFRLPIPTQNSVEYTFGWGGKSFSFYDKGDPNGPDDGHPGSLYGTSHDHSGNVAEISIPAPVISPTKRLQDLPTATLLQEFGQLDGELYDEYIMPDFGRPPDKLEMVHVGFFDGIYKLIFARTEFYNTVAADYFPFSWADLDISNPNAQGVWHPGPFSDENTPEFHAMKWSEYMAEIPFEWLQDNLGFTEEGYYVGPGQKHGVGCCGGSAGESFAVMGPMDFKNPPANHESIPLTPLLYFRLTQEGMDGYGGDLKDHSACDSTNGAALVTTRDEKEALIFATTKGYEPVSYGGGGVGSCSPNSQGWQCNGRHPQLRVYDTRDLIEVYNGNLDPWEPQPAWIFDLENYFFGDHTCDWPVGGMAYNRELGYLYVAQSLIDNDDGHFAHPIIHVFQVDQSPPIDCSECTQGGVCERATCDIARTEAGDKCWFEPTQNGLCHACTDQTSCSDYADQQTCTDNPCNTDCQWNNNQCEDRVCVDVDSDGFGTANIDLCPKQGLDCNDNNPNVYPDAQEICGDNIDNDCNGEADTLADGTQCCKKDATEACGTNEGICTEGIRTCLADGIWGDCIGGVSPQEETLQHCENGIDEDCDGSDRLCFDTSELVFYLRGDAFEDATGNHEVIAENGARIIDDETFGKVFDLDTGADDRITIKNAGKFTSGSFSLTFWDKESNVNNWGPKLLEEDGCCGDNGIFQAPGGEIQFNTNGQTLRTTKKVNPGELYHVAATYNKDTGEKRIYINGNLEAEQIVHVTPVIEDDFYIGDASNFRDNLEGIVAVATGWNIAITPVQAQALFENPFILDGQQPTPICGNNKIESGEQCDDGNLVNGDGCSELCLNEQNCLDIGTCTASFEYYPDFLIRGGILDATLVVGDNSPAEDLVAMSDIAIAIQFAGAAREGGIVIGSTKLASEIQDPQAQNLILVGRPTEYAGSQSNSIIDNFQLPNLESGESVLTIVQNGDYYSIIVSGKDLDGPRDASRILADFGNYQLQGDKLCVEKNPNENPKSILVPCESCAPEDINGDGAIDVFDLLVLATNFGPNPANSNADIDNDGDVDIFDMLALIRKFGERVSCENAQLTITSPQEGVILRENQVTVLYQLTNPPQDFDHVHYTINNGQEKRDLDGDGSFTETLADGSYNLRVYAADAQHNLLNLEDTVSFEVDTAVQCVPSIEICGDGIDQDCDGSDLACECIPSTEICDNIDNDCDDLVDEGLDCGTTLSPSCDPLEIPAGNQIIVNPGDNLKSKIESAKTGDVVILKDGIHQGEYIIMGTPGVTVIGESQDADKAIIDDNYQHTAVFNILASDITLAHFTVQEANGHNIHGKTGGDNFKMHDLHVSDARQQQIKFNANSDSAPVIENVEFACGLIDITDAGRPNLDVITATGCYTGGIDAHEVWGLTVRDSVIKDIYCDNNKLAEHAIHLWDKSKDVWVINNRMHNTVRGVGIGFEGHPHLGEVYIVNNVISADDEVSFFDTGIELAEVTDGGLVAHNTIYSKKPMTFTGIDARFSTVDSSLIIKDNIAPSTSIRTGATPTLINNIVGTEDMFVDVDAGDFHLVAGSSPIDSGSDNGVSTDIEGTPRDSNPDAGAYEYT